jgi:hypothetical protein
MASSSQDPQVGHSLWLQRRSGRQTVRRTRWRSDWTPVGLVVWLLVLLILLSMFLPANEAVERVKQSAQEDNNGGAQHPPVVGVLADP